MHTHRLNDWKHSHVFDQDQKRPGESRTLIVVLITASMMVIEIIAGVIYGSMALLADGLTSLLAIMALLAGKYLGASWLDPAMGIIGAILVARWSYGLIKDSSQVLLDRQVGDGEVDQIRKAIEGDSSDRVADLHCWSIGHGIYAAELVIVSDNPRAASHYKSLISENLNIVHSTIEIYECGKHQ